MTSKDKRSHFFFLTFKNSIVNKKSVEYNYKMIEYIEDFLFINLLTTFLLLLLTQLFVRQKVVLIKTFLVSLIHLTNIFLQVFFSLSFFHCLLIELLLVMLMSTLLVQKFSRKTLFLFATVFFSLKLLTNGLFVITDVLFNGNMLFISKLFIILFQFLLLKSASKEFFKKRKLAKFFYNLTIQYNGKTHFLTAYLDSGNLLQDSATGLSILVVNFDTFQKIFKDKINLIDHFSSRLDKKIDGKYISFSAVGTLSKMFVCKVDKVFKVEKNSREELHLLVGLSKGLLSHEYEALLSPLAL